MSNVLVTGGSGFLGSHIADALSRANHEVTILDIRPSPYLSKGQKMAVGSITNINFVEDLFREGSFDFVYHLAALADINEAKMMPRATAEINILGTLTLLEACIKFNVKRFLFGSSVYVYSNQGGFIAAVSKLVKITLRNFTEFMALILQFSDTVVCMAHDLTKVMEFTGF